MSPTHHFPPATGLTLLVCLSGAPVGEASTLTQPSVAAADAEDGVARAGAVHELSDMSPAERAAAIQQIEAELARRDAEALRQRRHPTQTDAGAELQVSAPDPEPGPEAGTGAIAGTVRRSSDSAVLGGVDVIVHDGSEGEVATTTTLADGSYTLSGLSPGRYYVRTSNSLGYADELYDDIACPAAGCWESEGAGIDVSDGTTQSGIDFALDASGTLSGTITSDPGGVGLASVSVYVDDHLGRRAAWATTAADGSYSISGLKGGNYYLSTWNSEGHIDELYDDIPCLGSSCTVTAGSAVSLSIGGTASGIDFALVAGGRISGTITDASTMAPLQDVRISVYDASGFYVGSGNSDAVGVYSTFSGLPAGTYYVRASGTAGYIGELYPDIPCPGSCTETNGTPVSVSLGATTFEIDFALTPGGQVSGTVTDAATGDPLPNVSVDIYDSAARRAGSGYTDSAGEYTTSGLPEGTYYAWTYNISGYVNELYDDITCPRTCNVTAGAPLTVTVGSPVTGVDFALDRGGQVSGTVTDAGTGGPLNELNVQIFDGSGEYAGSARTNGSGQYVTAYGLPAGSHYARTLNQSGYIDELYDNLPCPGSCTITDGATFTLTAGSITTGIDFGLAPGGRIAGMVTDASTGDPLQDIAVQIYDPSGTYVGSGRTDSFGQYPSTGLPTGTYFARISDPKQYIAELFDNIPCPGTCTVTSGTPISVTAPDVTTGIDFALSVGGRISGTVTHSVTGDPIGSLNVSVYTSTGAYAGYGITDSAGQYTSTGLSTGTYFAKTSNSFGYLNVLYDGIPCTSCDVTTGTPIAVTAGATSGGIDFVLEGGGRISGTVTDASTGDPVENVYVNIYDPSDSYVGYGRTDAAGQYTTGGLPGGAYYAKTSSSLGYVSELYDDVVCAGSCSLTNGTPITVTLGATTPGVDFDLVPGGTISGTVTDEATQDPVEGVFIAAMRDNGDGVCYANTDTAGRYDCQGLPAGMYRVRAEVYSGEPYVRELYDDIQYPGYVWGANGTRLSVAEGATVSGIDFALSYGATIRGRVTDADTSAGVEDVTVGLMLGWNFVSADTDVDGYYEMTGVPRGTYVELNANGAGYLDECHADGPEGGVQSHPTCAPITVSDGQELNGMDFALNRGARIRGTVTDADTGTPRNRVRVAVYNRNGTSVASASTNDLGEYATTAGLVPGRYYLRASEWELEGYLSLCYGGTPCPVESDTAALLSGVPVDVVGASDVTEVDFALPRGGQVSGRVIDSVSGGVLYNTVRIYDDQGRLVASGQGRADGIFSTREGLPSGTYYLVAHASRHVPRIHGGPNAPECSVLPDPEGSSSYACNPLAGTPIPVVSGQTTAIGDISLDPTEETISGAVVDGATGTGIAGLSLTLHDATGAAVGGDSTDFTGGFRIMDLRPGSYFLRTTNWQGYVDEEYGGLPCGDDCVPTFGTPIAVTEGGMLWIELSLSLGPRISGHVQDRTGSPVGDRAFQVFDTAGTRVAVASSSRDGHYWSMTGLPDGDYYVRTYNEAGLPDQLYDGVPCGAGCDPTNGTPVTISGGVAVSGIDFVLDDVTVLTVSTTGVGTVTSSPSGIDCGVDCEEAYAYGTVVTLSATPGAGQELVGWGGACSGTGLTCDVTMDGVKTATAAFGPSSEVYALSVSLGGIGVGTVTSSPSGIDCGLDCGESYPSWTPVTLTASAGAGSSFTGWGGACAGAGTALDCDLTMGSPQSVTASFDLVGEAVMWERLIGTEVVGTTLQRPGGTGWNAGAVSSKVLVSGNGYAEYAVPDLASYAMFGLSHGDTDGSYGDIDYALYTYAGSGLLMIYEKGVNLGTFGAYAAGDVLRVSVEGGFVTYRHNGQHLYTSGVVPTYPLLVDASLYNASSRIPEAVLAGTLAPRAGLATTDVLWRNLVKTEAAGSTLRRDSTTGWDGGASSAQELVSGDGHTEYRVSDLGSYVMFGLSQGDTDQSIADIDYAIYTYPVSGNAMVYESGVFQALLGPYAVGDVLRVGVENGVVTYSINGTLLYSSSTPPVYPLATDTSLYSADAVVADAQMGGDLREIVSWTHLTEVEVQGDALVRPVTGGWTAGAISSRRIASGNGGAEHVVADLDSYVMFGLSHGDTDGSYGDIDFALYSYPGAGTLLVYENGVGRGSFGSYAPGDRLKVLVEEGVVSYWRNADLLYTSALTPTYPLVLDVSLYRGRIEGARLMGNVSSVPVTVEDVSWVNLVGVTDSGGTLERPSGTGWDAGASSSQTIPGEGYAEFTVTATTGLAMFGLGNGDADPGYADIEYAFYTYETNGLLLIYEGGVGRGSAGPYVPGDVLRVAVEGGVVRYRKNAELVYTSAVAPSFPLNADTSLYSTGASIAQAKIGREE